MEFSTTARSITSGRTSATITSCCRSTRLPAAQTISQPIASVLPAYANQSSASDFPGLTLIDPKLRNGYAESFFLGVQQSLGGNLTLEVNGTGSVGHRLITTDIVNRQFTTTNTAADGRPNGSFPDVYWRSGQGNSDYTALTTLLRYQLPHAPVAGGLHLEPLDRRPERSADRRFLRSRFHFRGL